MTKVAIPLHAVTHLPEGSDPLLISQLWGFYAASGTQTVTGGLSVPIEGTLNDGTELFDYSAGSDLPAPLADGMYAISTSTVAETYTPAPTDYFEGGVTKVGTLQVYNTMAPLISVPTGITLPQASAAACFSLTTADQLNFAVRQTVNASVTYSMIIMVVKIG